MLYESKHAAFKKMVMPQGLADAGHALRNEKGNRCPGTPGLAISRLRLGAGRLISLLLGHGFPVLPKLFPVSLHREFR
ncbi:MAG: hypothetical protein WAV38_00175 [Xanthobacteraceae bacterium]